MAFLDSDSSLRVYQWGSRTDGLFPQRILRSYFLALVRFAMMYYPLGYLMALVSQGLNPWLPAGRFSFAMQDAVLGLVLLYPLLRVGPAIAAPLVGDRIRVRQAWKMTAGRFTAFMLPLLPLFLVRELVFWGTVGVPMPNAVYTSLSALQSVFWFAYCAVWYVELVGGPDPGRAARING